MGLRSFLAFWLLCAALAPASAQQREVKIGTGFGLAFLPIYICEDLKLVEKYAGQDHLDIKASFPRLMSAAQAQSEIASGVIDIAPFGVAPFLATWEKAKDTPQQILAVSGLTSLPLVLVSNRPDEHSIADLKAGDRIAVPTLTSPQVEILALQSEKVFGQYDHLRGQVIAMSHTDAVDALGNGDNAGKVTAYFSSPPFTTLALRAPNAHPILTSSDVIEKFSFLILGATRAYIRAQPQVPTIVSRAMDEAARIIREEPRRAAQIYLTHEPSGTLNGATMNAVMGDIKNEFGSAVYGVQAMADFMARHGELKTPPRSWKDVVAPALLNSSSS